MIEPYKNSPNSDQISADRGSKSSLHNLQIGRMCRAKKTEKRRDDSLELPRTIESNHQVRAN